MLNFQYHNPAKIVFGAGAEKELATLLKQEKATSLMLIYSGEFIKELGIYEVVMQACRDLDITFFENGSVEPNPRIELVRELAAWGKENGVDFILAVGGGSAIDTAKAVALGIPYNNDVWDFFVGNAAPDKVIPIGVISTLPSSGSETSNCAILSGGLSKLGFEHNDIIPKFAIMNPEHTLLLPPFQTSCGVADILSHLLERYFSDVSHTDVTDYMIEGATKALLLNGERVMLNPADINARAEIQWLGSIAHNNLLDTGRIGDWASHRIEHEISAQYGVTHGEGMAVMLVAWTKYIADKKPQKLAQLANRVFGVDYCDFTPKEMAEKLSEKLKNFFELLNLKTNLTQLGIGNEHFREMAARATKNGTCKIGHYFPLDEKGIEEVLEMAL